jgi:Mrp family chromosome partitioning ATPase
MTSTDQAFLRAYRRDAARTIAPAPTAARVARQESAAPAAWQTSVAFVGAEYAADSAPLGLLTESPPASEAIFSAAAASIIRASNIGAGPHQPPAPPSQDLPRKKSIGRRPLSSFINRTADDFPLDAQTVADQLPAAPRDTKPEFAPRTTVAAFRWPSICRAAWQRSAADYGRVADLVLKQSAAERRLVGIAGLQPGDGCTTTLLCLAAAVAGRGRRVILVDANFRAPQLAIQLGVEPETTWQDVLGRGAQVAEAVIRAQNDQVDLLPLGKRELDGSLLAAGLQTSVTAGVLRYAYDVVLLDLGAILAPSSFATTVHLLQTMQIDGALLVADRRQADQSDLSMAAELVKENGCEPLGIIENRAA